VLRARMYFGHDILKDYTYFPHLEMYFKRAKRELKIMLFILTLFLYLTHFKGNDLTFYLLAELCRITLHFIQS